MDKLDRATVSTILVVALAVVALGLVAATVNTVTAVAGPGGPTHGGPPSGGVDDPGLPLPMPGSDVDSPIVSTIPIDLVHCISLLQHPLAILAIVGGLVAVVYGLSRRYNVATAGLYATGIVPIAMATYFLLTNCGPSGSGPNPPTNPWNGFPPVDPGTAPTVPPSALALVFVGVMLFAAVTLVTSTRGSEPDEAIETEPPAGDAAAFARAAGRAADRIEAANVPVDNAVYRAWLEMTGLLDVERPATTTPMAFAEAAIEMGFDAADVAELTGLFTAVRYGGRRASEAREQRAIAVLRRIERSGPRTGNEPHTGDDQAESSNGSSGS